VAPVTLDDRVEGIDIRVERGILAAWFSSSERNLVAADHSVEGGTGEDPRKTRGLSWRQRLSLVPGNMRGYSRSSSREDRAPSLRYGAFQDAVLGGNQFGFTSLT
jgi:hypothetical protein